MMRTHSRERPTLSTSMPRGTRVTTRDEDDGAACSGSAAYVTAPTLLLCAELSSAPMPASAKSNVLCPICCIAGFLCRSAAPQAVRCALPAVGHDLLGQRLAVLGERPCRASAGHLR